MTNLLNQGLGLVVAIAVLLALLGTIDSPNNPIPALLNAIFR